MFLPLLVAGFCSLQLFSPTVVVVAFSPRVSTRRADTSSIVQARISRIQLHEKISDKRRKQLGIGEGEDEYDLGVALNTNTDPLISKIIAGSFILVMISLLVVGVIIPYTTDYGEGVCNPILTQGRC